MRELTIIDYASPFFILFVLLEIAWARLRSRESYEARDTRTSLLMGVGSTVISAASAGVVAYVAVRFFQHRQFELRWTWQVWAACFVLDDFNYYWGHRLGHRIRLFWASHVNHHSSQHYNLSTALRQTWTDFFTLHFLFRIWPAFIGFDPRMIFACGAVNLVYQFWIHTEAISQLPRPIEAIMNTPSHHRVHHAINPLYLDRNYAGVFIIWDRLFGTFQREDNDQEIQYGIVRQLGSFNLIWAVFHEWAGIARDVWKAPFLAKFGYVFLPPGWRHDGPSNTSDAIRAAWLDLPQAEEPIQEQA